MSKCKNRVVCKPMYDEDSCTPVRTCFQSEASIGSVSIVFDGGNPIIAYTDAKKALFDATERQEKNQGGYYHIHVVQLINN